MLKKIVQPTHPLARVLPPLTRRANLNEEIYFKNPGIL